MIGRDIPAVIERSIASPHTTGFGPIDALFWAAYRAAPHRGFTTDIHVWPGPYDRSLVGEVGCG